MPTPSEHYDLADQQLEQLEARAARVRENLASGQLGYAEGELAVRLLELDARIVTAHATLATVSDG
jgi:hypothetical protein